MLPDPDSTEQIISCLVHLLNLIKWNRNLLILNNAESKVSFVKLENATWMSWSENGVFYEEFLELLDTLVVDVKNSTDFGEYFEDCYINYLPLKGDGVLVGYFGGNMGELDDVFRKIWGCKIANAFLVTKNLQVYSYSPVSGCSVDVVKLGQCWDVKVVSKQSTNNGFNNCTLEVSVTTNRPFTNGYENSYGFEGGLLQVLAEKLDFNINLTCPQCLDPRLLHFVPAENYDVVAGGLSYLHPVQTSIAYYQSQNDYCFFVPLATPIPPWKTVFYIFDVVTWIAIVATLTVLVAISYLDFGRLDSAIAHVLSLLLTNSCLKARKLQFLFVLWSTAALLFTSSYSGLLTSFMCKSIPDQQVSTFEDILAYNYHFAGTLYDIAVANPTLFQHPKMGTLGTACTIDAWDCYTRLSEGYFAYFTSTHKIMHQMSYNWSHMWHKSPTIHNTYMAFAFRRSSPYVDSMQQYLTYIAECGILSKLDEYNWKPRQGEAIAFQVVRLKHVYFAFFLHATCTVVAVTVFVAELCFGIFAR